MRVIEPNKSNRSAASEPKKRSRTRPIKSLIIVLIIIIGIATALIARTDKAQSPATDNTVKIDSIIVTEQPSNESGLRQFSGNEFRILYDLILQQNLDKVDMPPAITGNDIADNRIRKLAESRGYKLRSNPTEPLVNIDGHLLQAVIREPWQKLKAEALENSINFTITSGYRTIAEQRQLFLNRLSALGVSTTSIIDGESDEKVNKVLTTTAVPGYSKHHNGYTFDLLCKGFAFENFKNSNCHDWLSANNYEKAKVYGFIPSYPADSDLQGPDPEAWEYVYVGTDVLYR